jgi:hypothetical protein
MLDSRFFLAGDYRVQSHRRHEYSELGGAWMESAGLLDSDVVNRRLAVHPAWDGDARVALRAARIDHRRGTFAREPDILYKREFYIPRSGPGMDVDIVDVEKSRCEWRRRYPSLGEIFDPDQLEALQAGLGDLDVVIANEYYVHEAGHSIGIDIGEKYGSGYFRLGGRTLWPLIYLEELRADLGGFEFASSLLPPEEAAQIFLYNVALRFGVHRDGIASGAGAPYGLVPFLLFCVLAELGSLYLVSVGGRARLRFAELSQSRILETMLAAARHAYEHITRPELELRTPVDRALHVARYVRGRLDHATYQRAFSAVMLQDA